MPETTLTWLGHSTFRFDTPGGKRVYIDPFLNGNPSCPESELEPERVDVIAITQVTATISATRSSWRRSTAAP